MNQLDRLASAAGAGESRTRVVTDDAAKAVLGGLAVTPGHTITYMGCTFVGNEDYPSYVPDDPSIGTVAPATIAG